jgi:hypothetical protein
MRDFTGKIGNSRYFNGFRKVGNLHMLLNFIYN